MKKYIILSIITFLVMAFANVALAENKVPDTFIVHHHWPADIDNPFGKYMKPINDRVLFAYPNSDKIVDTINAGESAKLMTCDLYTHPNKYPVRITKLPNQLVASLTNNYKRKDSIPNVGDYIYLMSYTGEGLYMAWYNDKVIYVPGNGIQGLAVNYRGGEDFPIWGDYRGEEKIKTEFWICLRTANGIEGWTKYGTYKEWQKNNYNIFFTI